MWERPRFAFVLFLLCFVYFFSLAEDGLSAWFTSDDVMNLQGYWSKPLSDLWTGIPLFWSKAYRPLGGLFYRSIFAVSGFTPFPFRIACYALMAANMALAAGWSRLLTNSWRASLAALLLWCYHARFMDLYYNTGAVYDILCFTCYFAAFSLYLRWRAELRLRRILFLTLLYILAMDSKEMAASFPMALALYEICLYRKGRSIRRAALTILLLAALTAIFIAGKAASENPVVHNPAYQPQVSVEKYLTATGHYFDELFYFNAVLGARDAAWILAVLFVLAAALRSRLLAFLAGFWVVGLLPVAFIPDRAGYVIYVPFVGLALYLSVLIVQSLDGLSKVWRRQPKWAADLLYGCLFLAAASYLWRIHLAQRSPCGHYITDESDRNRVVLSSLQSALPTLPKGAHVLVLDDPYGADAWTLVSASILIFKDRELHIDRLKWMREHHVPVSLSNYGFALTYEEGRMIPVPISDVPKVLGGA